MTPEELREKLARELWARLEDCTQKEIIDATDIALRVVREVMREPLARAEVLLSLVTVGQVLDAGDRAIDAAGINPWCVNEGRATKSDRISPWWLAASPLREE